MATYTKETALYDTGAIAQDIQEAGTKATNYLAADSSGIMVYDGSNGAQTPSSATTKNVFIDADSMDVRNGTDVLATFGADNSRIGGENSARLVLEPTMMSLISDENVNFFSVDSDIGTMTGNIKAGDKKSGFNSVTLTLNEVPSNLAINFRCNCSYHVYFAEGTSHVYNYGKRVNSNYINVAYPVVKKSGKDWSVSFNAYIGPIYYGTPLTTNTTKAYTFLKVDGNSEALQSYVYLDYDGAHSLTITLAVSRKSPVSAVDNKMIETTEPTYTGTIHGPAYSIGTREGVANLYSTIIGRSLETSAQDQLVIGKYNTSDGTEGCAFVIGNGTSSDAVSNALAVDWNGNVNIASGAKYKIGGVSLADIFYPVGSYYETSDADFDPNTAWGGTWVLEAEGSVHVSAGSTYTVGSSYGSNTHTHTTSGHTLTTNEIPAHTHGSKTVSYDFRVTQGTGAALVYAGTNSSISSNSNKAQPASSAPGTFSTHQVNLSASHTHDSVGGGNSHSHGDTGSANSWQPSIAVNRWHRTA